MAQSTAYVHIPARNPAEEMLEHSRKNSAEIFSHSEVQVFPLCLKDKGPRSICAPFDLDPFVFAVHHQELASAGLIPASGPRPAYCDDHLQWLRFAEDILTALRPLYGDWSDGPRHWEHVVADWCATAHQLCHAMDSSARSAVVSKGDPRPLRAAQEAAADYLAWTSDTGPGTVDDVQVIVAGTEGVTSTYPEWDPHCISICVRDAKYPTRRPWQPAGDSAAVFSLTARSATGHVVDSYAVANSIRHVHESMTENNPDRTRLAEALRSSDRSALEGLALSEVRSAFGPLSESVSKSLAAAGLPPYSTISAVPTDCAP